MLLVSRSSNRSFISDKDQDEICEFSLSSEDCVRWKSCCQAAIDCCLAQQQNNNNNKQQQGRGRRVVNSCQCVAARKF